MIIAVQRGLSSIKQKLDLKGYTTVYADEYSHPPDVYIRAGYSFGQSSPLFGGMQSFSGHFSGFVHSNGNAAGVRQPSGTIEINASEKSFDEIEGLLNRQRRQIDSFF